MIKIMVSSIFMILLGVLSAFCGITKGKVWGEEYIFSSNIGSISERDGMINAFIYTPIIVGALLIALGIIIFTIVFNNWTKTYLK